ncbi:MAG: glycosyltransferase family 4 protein [Clostridium sp.]|nr:glycosyltransferase family 4 protein [Clostridium sp.]
MAKITIVTKAMTSGGAERVIAQLANYFVRRGITCRIITTEQYEVMYSLDEKVELATIGKKSNNTIIDRILRYKAVRKLVLSDKPDVVLTMPEDTGIYAILALIGSGIPVFVSERNNPWVMPNVKITRLLRKLAYPFAKGIIFQTEMAKSFFPKYIQKKGIVLQNPVEVSRIPTPYTGERKKVFTAVGRLELQKNFSMLIRAFAKFHESEREYKLIIYGEGKERTNLEKLIKQLNLEGSVLLPGRNKDVLNAINGSAAFILSSDYEGMPNALIEAMCMGMPVISTDCPSGGPRELIHDGKNGLLVEVNNIESMQNAMQQIIDDRSEELGKSAYVTGKKLTDSQVFDKWEKVLFRV